MRALRDWWSADLDYDWVANYHRTHAFLSGAPYMIAASCFLLGVMAAASAVSGIGRTATPTGRWVLLAAASVAVALGFWWARGKFLSRRGSLAFVVIGGLTISIALLALPPSQITLISAALMVSVGNYASAFHGARIFVLQEIWALTLTGVLFVRLVTSTDTPLPDAVATLITVVVLLFAASALNHFFFTALRNDAARAYYDQLTGLPNRRGLHVAVEQMVRESRERGGGNDVLTVLCLDLDAFKSVNDRFGHRTGDDVLRTTAQRIDRLAGTTGVGARCGGEEFVVAVLGDAQRGCDLAKDLLVTIHRVDDPAPVSASVGVASAPVGSLSTDPIDALEQLTDRADEAMYEAKRGGGNRIVAERRQRDGVGGR